MSARPQPPRATITQVAQLAGVSISTASKALSGKGHVNPVLDERVRAVAQQLGYSPHVLAQALRTGRARILGLQVAMVTHYTTAAICEGVLAAAYAQDYAVAMCSTQQRSEVEHKHLEALARQRVAAVIALPLSRDAGPYLDLQAKGIPVVFMQRRPAGVEADLVASDYGVGTLEAIRHLLSTRRRRVALLAPASTYGSNEDRAAAYGRAHAEAGVPVPEGLICFSPRNAREAYAATRDLMGYSQPPDAIVAAGSEIVTPALACLSDLGVAVPGDVAFVGAGDVEWARLAGPSLTMIEIDGREIGRLAVQLALERLTPEGRDLPVREVRLPTNLIVRASSGRAHAALQAAGGPGVRG
ncbi:MAG: LacI family transcriptional regulator [Chloroflexi bacterium]|nr:LacI family transcriptional regulator [Chloroflexota bacterium]